MNQIVITIAELGTCVVCANEGRVRCDLQDWRITAIVSCPLCGDPGQVAEFVRSHMDYLARPGATIPDVTA